MKDKELSKIQFVLLVTVMFIVMLELVEFIGEYSGIQQLKANVSQVRK